MLVPWIKTTLQTVGDSNDNDTKGVTERNIIITIVSSSNPDDDVRWEPVVYVIAWDLNNINESIHNDDNEYTKLVTIATINWRKRVDTLQRHYIYIYIYYKYQLHIYNIKNFKYYVVWCIKFYQLVYAYTYLYFSSTAN